MYLVWLATGNVKSERFEGGHWKFLIGDPYWMPLPEAPK